MSYLRTLPFEQGSLDQDTYIACLRAASLGIPMEVAIEVCCSQIGAAGDVVKPFKVERQAAAAYRYVEQQRPRQLHRAAHAEFSSAALAKFIASSIIDETALAMRSPIIVAEVETPQDFLAALYPTNERVVVFTRQESQGQALWPLDPLPTGGPDGVWFLAQPVDGQTHLNPRQGNKPSRRSEEAITAFRYAVIESDKADPIQWIKCLARLPLRIAAIYTSGRRSIHALVRVDAESKAHWDALISPIKPLLQWLGADRNCLSAVRLTRLPNTLRVSTGERQRLLYLNPQPDGLPIEEQPILE